METNHNHGTSEKTTWFLLAGLGLIILVLIILLVNYQPLRAAYLLPSTTPSHTASPTRSPTPVLTSTRTPRPTWTLRPTDVPTITPTSTATSTPTRLALPTLTPALPYKFNFRYTLATPSAELAQRVTILMRQFPDLLYRTAEERHLTAYHQAYKFAAFAYQEALLRYPDSSQAAAWRWGLAFSQAQTGSPAASAAYATLVLQALQNENIPAASLAEWFHTQEPDLTMTVHPLGDPSAGPGYNLLEIQPGEFYLLVKEASGKIQVTSLFDTFIFDAEIPAVFYYGDLTGDGRAELAFYRQAAQDSRLHDPFIFDLNGDVPTRLQVEENQPLDVKMSFAASLSCPECSGSQAGMLQLGADIFPACPIYAVRSYKWDGSQFRSQPLAFSAQPAVKSLAYCETILTHAADFLPAPANVALLQSLQPLWPPPLDLGGRLYPADSQASLAYHLGIFQALSGDSGSAAQTFQAVANQDIKNWSPAASQFLEKYDGGAELYRTCSSAQDCSLERALQQVLSAAPPDDTNAALRLLWNSGLSTAADGVFDFNRDGQVERWFTLRTSPGQALEFWILARTSKGVQAVLVDFVEESKPPIYFSIAYPSDAVFQFEPKHGYALRLTKERQEPYIEEFVVEPVLTTYTRDQLAEAESSLFTGTPATAISRQLENVLSSGRFNCLTGRVCDRFDYLLGLTYELSGRDREAVDTYIKLWWENKNSPFTTMARSKLIFNPPVTPGPSPTPTAGSSPTEEPYPYPYPEPTDEGTTTPYPYP